MSQFVTACDGAWNRSDRFIKKTSRNLLCPDISLCNKPGKKILGRGKDDERGFVLTI